MGVALRPVVSGAVSMPVRKRNITASVTLLILALFLAWTAISTSRGVFSRLNVLDSEVQQLKTQLQRVSTAAATATATATARGASDTTAAAVEIFNRDRSAAKKSNGKMAELQLPVAVHTRSELKPELMFCFWAINPSVDKMEASSKQAIQTVQKFHGDYHLLGAGAEFNRVSPGGFTDGKAANRLRYQVLVNYINDQEAAGVDIKKKIYVVMDGEDSLIMRPPQHVVTEFLRMKKRLVISAEKAFTYQYGDKKQMYEDHAQNTPYKYINAGTFMGYGDSLREMSRALDYIMTHDRMPNDMGAMGMYVADFLERKLGKPKTADSLDDFLEMDREGKIFWVTTDDNGFMRAMIKKGANTFQSPPYHSPHVPSGAVPAVYHIIGGSREFSNVKKTMFKALMDMP